MLRRFFFFFFFGGGGGGGGWIGWSEFAKKNIAENGWMDFYEIPVISRMLDDEQSEMFWGCYA